MKWFQDSETFRILTEHSDATDRPIVHLVFDAYSIPAALAGDGIHALLQLGLELISMSAGTMLLEEPEAFQHPRRHAADGSRNFSGGSAQRTGHIDNPQFGVHRCAAC